MLARDTTATGSYPIVLVSYQLACRLVRRRGRARASWCAFLQYIASEQGQAAAAAASGSAPISEQLRADALAVLDSDRPRDVRALLSRACT
jgi:phosphate transport system substrate-binding protein